MTAGTMDDIIKLLPESVSSRIAAGEVVQRPSSVVKEMMENSIDAGATSIRVILTDAGRTSIQVIDNGCGMSESDAVTAFQRHATSKIHDAEDIYSLSTFGFRGEALPSIAAVSEVQLRTRREADEVGTLVEVRGDETPTCEPVSCPVGCHFTVKNLFYNLPARRKFLKSNQTELSNIMKEVERVALAHPELEVSVWHQGSEILSLQSSSVKQRIVGLFGPAMNKTLLPVSTETSAVSVSGFISSLDGVRKRGAEQFFFVNGRFMRHPYFHKAVLEPYENLVPAGEQPSYFLFLTVPADTIDVNIHPSKTEIKFEEEQLVWKILNAAVHEAIGRFEGTTSIDFDVEGMPDIPIAVENVENVQQPKVSYNPSFNPFKNVSEKNNGNAKGNWTKLFGDLAADKVRDGFVDYGKMPENELADNGNEQHERKFLRYGNGYIVCPSDNGIIVIDQRRAHVRVLFERFISQFRQGAAASQGLLFPEMIQLSPSDAALLAEQMTELSAFGFDLSDMGHGAVAIQGVPSGLEGVDYGRMLQDILHTADDGGASANDRRVERMASTMASAAAVRMGDRLSDKEVAMLISDLEKCGMPARTAEGKVIFTLIDDKELSSRF